MKKIIIGFVILLLTGQVIAQTTGQPSPAGITDSKVQAKKFYMTGQQAYDAGNYTEAIKAFEKSYSLYSHPNILYNIAKAYEKLAKYNKAIEYYEKYLKRYQEFFHKPAPETEDVKSTIKVLHEKAYNALPTVTIKSQPIGADIYIDDPNAIMGQTPFSRHMKPGTHKLWLKKQGYQPFETAFIVGKSDVQLSFSMKESAKFAFLKFKANIQGAQIFVDGKVVGITPFHDKFPVKPGRHQVAFAKEGYNRVSKVVYLAAAQTRPVKASMFLLHKGFSWRGYLGITGLVLGAGAITFSALYFRDIANDYYPGTTYYTQFRNYTYIGYGVGGALAAMGAGMLIWEFTRKSTGNATADRWPVMPIAVGPSGISARIGF